jgi:hypothetical protein
VSDGLTYGIEAAVGAACIAAGASLWARPGLRWASVLLGLAGLAAVVHAVWALG